MAEEKRGANFWTTLPGVLTGAGAFVSALTGAYVVVRSNAPAEMLSGSPARIAAVPDQGAARLAVGTPGVAAPATPPSPIELRVDAALAATLGKPLGAESDSPGGGRARDYENGSVYWHPRTGAFTIQGAIRDKFRAIGGTAFGYPITDELLAPDGIGRFNHLLFVYPNGFGEERSIYWRPGRGAWSTQGLVRAKWAETGWERGPLGYPTSDEYWVGPLRRQDFDHGRIDWSPATGAVVVPG